MSFLKKTRYNYDGDSMKKNKKSISKKYLILIVIFIIFLLLLFLLLTIKSFMKTDPRYYDYNKLINYADEKNNYFKFDCSYSKKERESKTMNCVIKINHDEVTSIDSKYILEYLLLDYKDTDDLEIESIDATGPYSGELSEYFKVSKENNRIIVENIDKRVGNDIYFDEYNVYRKESCGKDDDVDYTNKIYLACQNTIENVEFKVKFKVLKENNDKVNINNFGILYAYMCDYGSTHPNCRNYKFSKLKASLNISNKNDTNTEPNKTTDYSSMNVPVPPAEENINISNNDDMLNLGYRLWQFAFDTYWGYDNIRIYFYGENNNVNDFELCKSNFKNFSSKYTDDFSSEYCLGNGNNCSKYDLNNFLTIGCNGVGRGGLQDYKKTSLRVDSIKDDEIKYIVVSEYCGGSFCHETQDTVRTIEKPFIIKKVDNKWKINYFYLPN